jgi:hypothetical protein
MWNRGYVVEYVIYEAVVSIMKFILLKIQGKPVAKVNASVHTD